MNSKKIIVCGVVVAVLLAGLQIAVTLGFMRPIFTFSYSGAMQNVVLLLTFGLSVSIYLLPAFVALTRKHINTPAICVLNILVGWTFIGWVVALVWALVKSGDKK